MVRTGQADFALTEDSDLLWPMVAKRFVLNITNRLTMHNTLLSSKSTGVRQSKIIKYGELQHNGLMQCSESWTFLAHPLAHIHQKCIWPFAMGKNEVHLR